MQYSQSNPSAVAVERPTFTEQTSSKGIAAEPGPARSRNGWHHPLASPPSSTPSPDCARGNSCDIYLRELEDLNPSIARRSLLTMPDQIAASNRNLWNAAKGAANQPSPFALPDSFNGRPKQSGAGQNNHPRAAAFIPPHMAVPFGCHSFLDMSAPKGISVEDLAFLEAQGCLHLPPTPVLTSWLQQYFVHVHVFMPLLTDASFGNLIRHDVDSTKTDRISLFLFHAILATASPVGLLAICRLYVNC